MAHHYLAFDLGAASGRAMLGTLQIDRLRVEELHRFTTPLVERDGHLFWDLGALWAHIREGLRRALLRAPDLHSVSVDSWAVDYVPLDKAGFPLRDPFCYRDPRTRGRLDQAFSRVPPEEIYRRTGIQMQEFNTLVQVLADVEAEPELIRETAQRLLIADYLLFLLSGRAIAERSMASTTQLMDVWTGEWDRQLIVRLGLPESGWPEIVPSGSVLGPLKEELTTRRDRPVVIATCSHDTGAAVAGVPAEESGSSWAYLSTGTWALLGVERGEPIVSEEARAANFTNEAGLDGTVRFLKNLMGMWILQECEREDIADRVPWDYAVILAEAEAAVAPDRLLDVADPRFAERGGMRARISAWCAEAGIPDPRSRGELVRLLLASLAGQYGRALIDLERLTGESIAVLHVVGGAARNGLLCQLIADSCGRRIIAGPSESTTVGNILIQARTLGHLPPRRSIRDVARLSGTLHEYLPRQRGARPDGVPIQNKRTSDRR